MGKMKYLAVILIIMNILPAVISMKGYELPTDEAALKVSIALLKKELEECKRIAAWAERAEKAVESHSVIRLDSLLAELRETAFARDFTIDKMEKWEGKPGGFRLAGVGKYFDVAALLNKLEKSSSGRLKSIKIVAAEQGDLEVTIEASVRSGLWGNQPGDDKMPEPIRENSEEIVLGKVDIFDIDIPPAAEVSAVAPKVRYLGYFAPEAGTPSVILEENGRAHSVRIGEIYSPGKKVCAADEDKLEISDERGNRWRISIEGPKH